MAEDLTYFLGSQHKQGTIWSAWSLMHAVGTKDLKSELCVKLRGYSLTSMKETWWDSLQDWIDATDGYGFFRKDKPGGLGRELPFEVKECGNTLP